MGWLLKVNLERQQVERCLKNRSLEDKYEELGHLLADPKVMEDQRIQNSQSPRGSGRCNVYRQYNRVLKRKGRCRQLLAEEEPEFKEMVRRELEELVQKKEKLGRI